MKFIPHHPKPIVIEMIARLGVVAGGGAGVLGAEIEGAASLDADLGPFYRNIFGKLIRLGPFR